jgi:predicted ester cyclase
MKPMFITLREEYYDSLIDSTSLASTMHLSGAVATNMHQAQALPNFQFNFPHSFKDPPSPVFHTRAVIAEFFRRVLARSPFIRSK